MRDERGGSALRWVALLLLAACGGAGGADAGLDVVFGGDNQVVVTDPGSLPGTDASGTPDAPPPADVPAGEATDDGPGSDVPLTCSARTKLVYVVSEENVLMRFLPATGAFETVGPLDCPAAATETPFSMAIDRQGTAWILYSDGHLYQASTVDASCTIAPFVPSQEGFDTFGMGFSSDEAGGEAETLFISELASDGDPARLGTVSLPGLEVTPVGAIAQGSAELTGNGRGELWGYFPGTTPPVVARIDKATATLLDTFPLPADVLGDVVSWAFAFWGGRFYLFTANLGDDSSHVYRLDPATSEFLEVNPAVGQTIVGAGVSSCAPLGEP